MRRAQKWLLGIAGVLVLLPVVLVAAVLAALNVAPGQRLVERLTAQFTGGQVVLAGLAGVFPEAPRIGRIELHDSAGTWLVVEDVALDWSPLRLISRDALIQKLSMGHITVARLPAPGAARAPAQNSSAPFTLPVRVDVDALVVDRLDVGVAVAGHAAAVALEGQVHLAALTDGSAVLAVRDLDGSGTYHLSGQVDAARLAGRIDVAEPAHGLISQFASLPDLGALSAAGGVDGPWSGAAVQLALTAGPLRATAQGRVDLDHRAADLTVTANAPAMAPRPDVSWQSVMLNADVHGPFTAPEAAGTLRIVRLAAAGASLGSLAADVSGNAGHVALHATLERLRIPGPRPDLLASAPLVVTAEATLDEPTRPVTFAVSHPLLQASGRALTGTPVSAQMTLTLPDLAPLAAIGGVDLQGHSALTVKAVMRNGTTSADIDGDVAVTGGMAPVPALLGDAKIGVSAALQGQDVTLSRLQVDGRTLSLSASGGMAGGAVKLDWKLALADLAVAAPTLSGRVDASGHVEGPTDHFAATVEIAGDVGASGVPRGPVKFSVQASGLPGSPAGHLTGEGRLAGAPLSLAVAATRSGDGALAVSIERADWNSAHAEGALTLTAGATLPRGKIAFRMTRLDDLRPLIGRGIAGGVQADIDLTRPDLVAIRLDARGAGLPGTATVGVLTVNGEVRDPIGHPSVNASLVADGIQADAIAGGARLEVNGPQDALALRLSSALRNIDGADATVSAAAVLDIGKKAVAVSALAATWRGETLRLLAPARVSFADGVAVDRLRLGLRQAVLEVVGRVSPALDLTASLRNVTADLARIVVPDLQADGTLQADARLTGTPARPAGTVRVTAAGLHLRTGPARSLPPAGVTANVTLAGDAAHVDVRLAAGTTRLAVAGEAPLGTAGALDLHATGAVDLAVLDPILLAGGRRVRGQATLDATVTGTVAAPRLAGGVQLAHGEVQDFTQGVHLTDVQARLEASGDTLRIAQFSAHAGPGTITVSGTIGVLAADLPVDITVTARNARPLASDLLTALLDADLTVKGAVRGHLAAGGKVHIRTARIQVPERIPTSVAVLAVRVPGQKPPPPPAPGPDIALDLDLAAPEGIFVSGRGLDAELGGNMRVRGTAAAPLPSGGFELRRGQFSLAGTVLTFSSGEVQFNGAGKIDPTLNFVATSTNGSITATLTITGYASKPVITLSSVPDLPQDEVLAQLLFHASAASLSPFQLAEIAAALAQISGVTSGVGDPLAAARKALGLDQLNVGSSTTGAPTLQAGRYVAPGVYVGATQGTSGADTQASVQIDITKGLKLETGAGTGPGANSIGLKYQFDY